MAVLLLPRRKAVRLTADGRATGADLATVETVVDGVAAGLVGAVAVGDSAETAAGAELTVLPAVVASLDQPKVDREGLIADR